MLDVHERFSPSPARKILIEVAVAADDLLELEDVDNFELDWDRVVGDPSLGIYVRRMLVRRRRWAAEYGRMIGIFRRQVTAAFIELIEKLPACCFDQWSDDEALFTVPLVALLDDPAAAVERLMLAPYDDETLQYEVFHKIRDRITTNMLVASGFAPTANAHELADRLIPPTRQKKANPTELADMYLGGTPLARIFELPVPFEVPAETRFEHCHIIGGTGHGKTQLMQRLVHADLIAAKNDGRSVVVIDSQGDLVHKLVRLDLFAPCDDSLADRLILIDPNDIEQPPSLNLFDAHLDRLSGYGPAERERVLNGVIELYETFFGALLGAELTQKQGVIFRYLARLMLAIPGATIHTLMQLMEDGAAFRPHMKRLEGSARYFFEKEFFHPSFAATKKQILKRLWGVLSSPAFERMFAQRENKLDLFDALNSGKIILVSTAKDLLKTEGSQLLGRFVISMLSQAALERSTIDPHKRVPSFVYIDEAQEYFDDSIEAILTQARKYRVGLTLAHQSLDQLSPRLRSVFLSNTSVKCAGGVSSKDAHALAPELRTTSDFIESMRRHRERTEFAVWVKHQTAHALQLSVALGFLERQPTLTEDQYDLMIEFNRARYCGTPITDLWEAPSQAKPSPDRREVELEGTEPTTNQAVRKTDAHDLEPGLPRRPSAPTSDPPSHTPGKGGPKHRYLQSLVKKLAEQQAFRATIEAPLHGGKTQVDVLLERNDLRVAVEVSVNTPAVYELESVRKALAAGIERVAVVLAKSSQQDQSRARIAEGLAPEEAVRVAFLLPEELPDYLASFTPLPESEETRVRGYKVRVSQTPLSLEDAQDRRDRLARVVARSLGKQKEN